MNRNLGKRSTSKIKAAEKKAHTCKCHLMGHSNMFRTHELDNVPLISLVRPVADLAGKEIPPRDKANQIQLREGDVAATYRYMVVGAR
jgi:hypothetical protein